VHASRAEGREALAGFKAALRPAGKVSYAIDNDAEVNALLPQLQESQVRSSIVNLSTQYKNRYYTTTGGVDASNDLTLAWKQLAAGRTDVTVKQFTHAGWPQKSVILTIKGATKPKEIVVIDGHLDSTVGNTGENSMAPGADDDASGVSSLQEVARVLLSSGYHLVNPLRQIHLYPRNQRTCNLQHDFPFPFRLNFRYSSILVPRYRHRTGEVPSYSVKGTCLGVVPLAVEP
jgi:leucyl aminopeptidase